jgi:hypothetical protein
LVEGFDYLAARSEAGDLLGERDLARGEGEAVGLDWVVAVDDGATG